MRGDGMVVKKSSEKVGRWKENLVSILPVIIIAFLIYAAFFIKPQAKGVSASRPVIEKRDRFYGVATPENNVVWAVGNFGKIVRSEDGGKNWVAQPSGTEQHLQALGVWDTSNALAVGNSGVVLITDDAGKNWRSADIPSSVSGKKLIRARAYAEDEAWVVGEQGAVLTRDSGKKIWRDASGGGDVTWNDVARVGSRVCLVGEFGHIRCSDDHGENWKEIASPVTASLYSVAFRNATDGVAVGVEGSVIVTHDAGEHWRDLPRVTEQHLYDVYWDGSRWLVVGAKGTLLTAASDANQWNEIKSSGAGSFWHTQIVKGGDRYAIVGQGISFVNIDVTDR
jgi:photosystem II stability/assembly factor-like uncharacterized protein